MAGRLGLIAALALLPAAAGAAPALEEYGKLPAVERMELSPSGADLAYIAVDGEARKLVVQETGGAVKTAIGVGELRVRQVDWLDDDHILVVASRAVTVDRSDLVAKQELAQSILVNVRTAKFITVFNAQPKIAPMTFGDYGVAHIGGKAYGYFGGLTLTGSGDSMRDFDTGAAVMQNGFIDLYRVDLDTGHPDKVVGGSALYASDWAVAPNGVVAGVAHRDRTGAWGLFADPAASTPIERLSDPTGDVELLGQGRTAETLLVDQPGEAGDWSLIEYPRAGGPGVDLTAAHKFRNIVRDPATRLLIGGVTNEDEPKTILFDPTLQAKFDKVVRAFPGETVELKSATGDLSKMVVETNGPGDSGTFFLIDLAAGKAQAIGWEHPKILQGDVAASRIVAYSAGDGLAMQGVLTLPPGKAPSKLPLVVMPHGGPEARDYLGFDWWAQAFASRGYAVFQPNFRGSDGFGKAFRDAGYGQWGRKMQTDISDGVAELARQGVVDPKRACIVGASYGGYAALAGVTLQQGLYRCAVAVGGVADLAALHSWTVQRYGADSIAVRDDRLFMGPDAGLKSLSPRALADHADAPVLLVFGKDDTVVPPAQSQDMRAALSGAGKPVETVVLAGEDHWLSRQETRTQMLTASVAFVEKNNPPD